MHWVHATNDAALALDTIVTSVVPANACFIKLAQTGLARIYKSKN